MSQLNLKFYSGCDQYSDGDVEDDILRYVKESEPEQYKDILARDQRFPVFYHLSSYRQHLLDWYKLDHNASLLEIGGGMGAFTHMFCEKCANVTTVELSKRRAEAIRWRCRDQDNLEIYVGDTDTPQYRETHNCSDEYAYAVLSGTGKQKIRVYFDGAIVQELTHYLDFS